MISSVIASQWLSGEALPYGYLTGVPTVGDSPVDITGTTITVGKMVKMIGTVVAINPNDAHFQDITVQVQFPQSRLIQPNVGVFPLNLPAPNKYYQFHALQLMVIGSQY